MAVKQRAHGCEANRADVTVRIQKCNYVYEFSLVDCVVTEASEESVQSTGFVTFGVISCVGHISTQMNDGPYGFWLPLPLLDLLCL